MFHEWRHHKDLNRLLDRKLKYHVVVGGPRTGKSIIAKQLARKMGWVLIEWTYEAEVPALEILEGTAKEMRDINKTYIVDGFPKGTNLGAYLFTALGELPRSLILVECPS